jgi:hypothetical protein
MTPGCIREGVGATPHRIQKKRIGDGHRGRDQLRAQAEQQHQAADLRLEEADRIGLALYRHAGRGEPGQAGRHHGREARSHRRDVRRGPGLSSGRVGKRSNAVDAVIRRGLETPGTGSHEGTSPTRSYSWSRTAMHDASPRFPILSAALKLPLRVPLWR